MGTVRWRDGRTKTRIFRHTVLVRANWYEYTYLVGSVALIPLSVTLYFFSLQLDLVVALLLVFALAVAANYSTLVSLFYISTITFNSHEETEAKPFVIALFWIVGRLIAIIVVGIFWDFQKLRQQFLSVCVLVLAILGPILAIIELSTRKCVDNTYFPSSEAESGSSVDDVPIPEPTAEDVDYNKDESPHDEMLNWRRVRAEWR